MSESAWEEMTCLFAPSLGLLYYYGQGVDKNIKKQAIGGGRQQMQGMHLLRMTWQCFIKMDY
ncbi:MAG: hypothetical protein ACLR9W_11625 [Enterobacter hormaechei]